MAIRPFAEAQSPLIGARATALCATAALLLATAGCGSDDPGRSPDTRVPAATAAKANAICREFRRDISGLGKGVLSGDDFLAATTEKLVKPSIPLLERIARRQQALAAETDNPDFVLYASLFDPVIVLARERLRSGRAEDAQRSTELEEKMTTLGVEQIDAARKAGLLDCDDDFQHILLNSLSG